MAGNRTGAEGGDIKIRAEPVVLFRDLLPPVILMEFVVDRADDAVQQDRLPGTGAAPQGQPVKVALNDLAPFFEAAGQPVRNDPVFIDFMALRIEVVGMAKILPRTFAFEVPQAGARQGRGGAVRGYGAFVAPAEF